ncbi:MAG: ankyrin repeat domain-containing protein, partial [Rickettsia endosymbiont of Ixodes persulcatus]|nr:ankyrin repeat domain-containing protein [Rickettsia endosymbiont of Ixodes persulcatus]
MLMSNLIDINQIYENRGNKSTDEPLGCFTAVSLAVYSNNLPMLKILFENSADLDFYNKLQTVKVSQTPLAIAVSNDNPDIVDFLLEKGITIWNKEESFACSAIRVAITMDFQCDKESAYYFKLLFNK